MPYVVAETEGGAVCELTPFSAVAETGFSLFWQHVLPVLSAEIIRF